MFKKLVIAMSVLSVIMVIITLFSIPVAVKSQIDYMTSLAKDRDFNLSQYNESVDVDKGKPLKIAIKDYSYVTIYKSYDDQLHIEFQDYSLNHPELEIRYDKNNKANTIVLAEKNNDDITEIALANMFYNGNMSCDIYIPEGIELEFFGAYNVYNEYNEMEYNSDRNAETVIYESGVTDTSDIIEYQNMSAYEIYTEYDNMFQPDNHENYMEVMLSMGKAMTMAYASGEFSELMNLELMGIYKENLIYIIADHINQNYDQAYSGSDETINICADYVLAKLDNVYYEYMFNKGSSQSYEVLNKINEQYNISSNILKDKKLELIAEFQNQGGGLTIEQINTIINTLGNI